eukprot:jgi/Botrbrau1/17287/Bobra.0015s0044.1
MQQSWQSTFLPGRPLHLSLATTCWHGGALSRVSGQWLVQRPRQRCRLHCTANKDPYELLQVTRSCTKEEVRAAYLVRIREVHPDVTGSDTNAEAAELNAAYQLLMQAAPDVTQFVDLGDVFDNPDGEATEVFVNPFSCGINPLRWRDLQEVARSDREDPEEALQKAGIACGYSGIHYLTWSQLGVICDSFEEMEATLDFESTAWYVMDCLNRARQANARAPSQGSRW